MKLFFVGQLAVTYAGLADFFGDVSYQAEDAWLEEISKSSEERWHGNQCQEYLLPNVPGGYWECKKGMTKCALKCNNAPGVHASVKCKGSTWKGAKGAKCPTKDPKCECKDSAKPKVDHGFWDCYSNSQGQWVCDLICDEEKNGARPPLTPAGEKVQIKCNHKNGKWWCNDVDPHCPAPDVHCPESKLRPAPDGARWSCDKKKGHCNLICPEGVQPCLAECNRKKCQWEYGGKIECQDPCNKHKKRRCEDTCGQEHPYCCTPEPDCLCKKFPERDECQPTCDKCPKPGDGSGDWECKLATIVGETKCTGKGKKQVCKKEPDTKRYVCQFNCRGKFTNKMIVCRDNKWFGNVATDKFTCNPTCREESLAKPPYGKWECTDKYDEEKRETIRDYHCNFTCKDGYEPKQPTEAICNVETGEYSHNCQARCVKSCESKGMSPCETGKGCCPRPCGPPCDKQKKPKVAGAWWECMIDEHCKETCMLKCLNGIIPTNKHGYHVSIKCDKARWWANDPCIADLCKADPVPQSCSRDKLPFVQYGDWECNDGNKGQLAKPGTICTLACDNGDAVHHAYECSPDGDWFERYGTGKCECTKICNSKEECCKKDSPNPKDKNYNPLCDPCPNHCPKDECNKKDLPPIHGNGSWRCDWIKNGKGHKEYACVLMCGNNKTKQIMACRSNDKGVCKWRGNVNGVCKCDEHCDMADLINVHHGEWGKCKVADNFSEGISTTTCNLECNGKVVTSCEATCSEGKGQKGNWKYSTDIKPNYCANVKKDQQDPCKDGCLKCNDYNVPPISNGQWDCKKKHCDLVCNKGYKTIDGKCSLKCENHAWKTIGNPKCVKDGPSEPEDPTCPQFVQVKNGWMECKKVGKAKAECMLMCNENHTPEYCEGPKDVWADLDCDSGYFNPRGPKGKKSKWGCAKGWCDQKIFGQVCWDHPKNKGQKKPSF